MMNVSLSVSVQPEGQTAQVEQSVFSVEALDTITVVVPASASDMQIDLSPGTEPAIQLVVIRSSAYSSDLTYKVHAATEDPIQLQYQAVFTGQQDLLAGSGVPFDKLFVSNGGVDDVTLSILCGRDATP